MNLDEIFKAYDIRGPVPGGLNPEVAYKVGKAFVDFLPAKGVVAVGRDMRPDSGELADHFIKGVTEQGRDVWDIGLVTSDMSYFAVGKYDLAGSAMITASHNPGRENGIKLYRDHVIAVGLDSGLDTIRDAVAAEEFKPAAGSPGKITKKDIAPDWIAHCLSFAAPNLPTYNIAIDTANGMAGAILPLIQPKLPFKVSELFYKLDGTFPNHEPNPHIPENLKTLAETVKKQKLDFGIAFDGDGDRAALVDDKGRPVLGSDTITIIARAYLEQFPGSSIVFDVRTSRATAELIAQWGGIPVRTKAGRVNIGPAMKEINAPFGGETTGHLFFRANYFADSALVGALALIDALAKSGKKLSQLVDEYHRYATTPEINFTVADKAAVIQTLAKEFKDGEQTWLDGLTVDYKDWWFNVRPSNTEPLLRLNIEANSEPLLQQKIKQVRQIIEG